MKKYLKPIAIALVTLIVGLIAIGCGNKQLVDLHFSYDYAIIQRADGEQRIELASWRDYEEGDQLQLIDIYGNVYLVNSVNTILVDEP